MSKKEDLIRRCINHSALVNQQTPRYYVVYQIKYDFESGGWYSVKDLSKTGELKRYGTYEGAKKYALNLYHKYKKELGEDLEVCINEELIDLNENKKLKNRVADLEAKLAESEKKREYLFSSNCDYISQIEELKQQLAEKEKEILNISEYFGKVTFELRELCNKKDQDKISFCIEQLEKVKCETRHLAGLTREETFFVHYDTFRIFIDNQIKQLKEGK